MHPWLAFLCFFRLLFGRNLPAEAAQYLPEDLQPKLLPERAAEAVPKPGEKPAAAERAAERAEKKVSMAQQHREGALALLALLQREGRFVDFVRDSVDG